MVSGQACVLHFSAEFRRHPGGVGGIFSGNVVDRRSFAGYFLELATQLGEVGIAETSTDAAGVDEVTVLVLHCQKQ